MVQEISVKLNIIDIEKSIRGLKEVSTGASQAYKSFQNLEKIAIHSSFQQTTDSVNGTVRSMEQFNYAASNLIKAEENVIHLNKMVTESFEAQERMTKQVGQANQTASDSQEKVSRTIQETSKTSEIMGKVMSKTGDTVKTAAGVMLVNFIKNDNFVKTLKDDFSSFAKSSVKEFVQVAKSVTDLFAAFASGNPASIVMNLIKLNKTASDSFRKVANDATDFNNKLKGTEDAKFSYLSLVELLQGKVDRVFNALKFTVIGVGAAVAGTALAVNGFGGNLGLVSGTTTAITNSISSLTGRFNGLKGLFLDVVKSSSHLDKTFVGAIKVVGLLGAGMTALGSVMRELDSETGRISGQMIFLAGLALTGLSWAVTKATIEIGKFARELGTKMVQSFQNAVNEFIKFDKQVFIFQRTVTNFGKAFGPAIGKTDSWTKTIEDMSRSTGKLEGDLRLAAAEIIATTSSMGLNEDQMKKLLEVSVDYASMLKKDVVDTSIEVVQALNGQSQGVQKYGVKLTETAVQHKLYEQGITKSLDSMTEHEKVLARFNSLLKQYAPQAGLAASLTGTLAGQEELYKNNKIKLNQALGEGAFYIENFNLLYLGLNKVLDLVNPKILSAAGFVGALGSRLVQASGFILENSLKVLSLVAAIQLFNAILKNDLTQSLMGRSLPLLNMSFFELAGKIGITRNAFSSLGTLLPAIGRSILEQTKVIIAAVFGVNAANLTLMQTLRAMAGTVLTKVVAGLRLLAVGLSSLLLNPVVITISAVSAAFYVLYKAVQEVEKRTKVFSETFSVLKQVVLDGSSVFQPLIDLFNRLKDSITELVYKGFGRLVSGIASITESMLSMAKNSVLGKLFNKEQIEKLEQASVRLKDLQQNLQKVSFDIRSLAQEADRKLAQETTSTFADVAESVKKLKDELKDVGKNEIQKAEETLKERISIINRGLAAIKGNSAAELIQIKELKNLKLKAEQDYQLKVKEITDRELEDKNRKAKDAERLARRELEIRKEIIGLGKQGVDSPIQSLFGEPELNITDEEKKQFAKEIEVGLQVNLAGAVVGIISQITKGAEGAKNILKKGVETAASTIGVAFMGPIGKALGPVAGELFEVLSMGPEAIKQMINQFVESVPTILMSVLESLPVLIEQLVLGFEKLVIAIIEKADRIVVALVTGLIRAAPTIGTAMLLQMPRVATALAMEMPNVAIQFVTALVEEAPRMVESMLEGVYEGVKDIFKKLNPFGGGGGGKGGIGGFLQSVPIIGGFFHEGGQGAVRKVPGIGLRDSVMAGYTPNELVVDRSNSSRLENFLDDHESGGGDIGITNALLAQIVGLLQQDQKVETSVEFNQKTLADILVNLSRTGVRTDLRTA